MWGDEQLLALLPAAMPMSVSNTSNNGSHNSSSSSAGHSSSFGLRHQHHQHHSSRAASHHAAHPHPTFFGSSSSSSRKLSSSSYTSTTSNNSSSSARSPRSPPPAALALPHLNLLVPPPPLPLSSSVEMASVSSGVNRARMPSTSAAAGASSSRVASSSSRGRVAADDDETESDDDLTEEDEDDDAEFLLGGFSAIDDTAAAWTRTAAAGARHKRPSQSRSSSSATAAMQNEHHQHPYSHPASAATSFASTSTSTQSPSKSHTSAAAALASSSSSRAYHKSPSTLQERKRSAKQAAVEKSVARREKLSGGMMAAREPIDVIPTDDSEAQRDEETTTDSDATEEEMPHQHQQQQDVDVDMGATPTAASYLLQSRNIKGKGRHEAHAMTPVVISPSPPPPPFSGQPQTRKERRRSEKDRRERQHDESHHNHHTHGGSRRSQHPPVGSPPEGRHRLERGGGGGRGEDVDVNVRTSANAGVQRRGGGGGGAQQDPDATEDEADGGNDKESAVPSAAPAAATMASSDDNDFPLPEGIDPADIEDVFLDATPLSGTWSDSSEDEEILFAALESLDESAQSAHEEFATASGSGTDDEGSNSDDDGDEFDEDDDFMAASDAFGANMPLVLMEDWSGNLVFAQPRSQTDGADDSSRSTSKSRRKSRTTSRTSGSTGTGNDVLLVDVEAMDDDTWDEGYEDDVGDCDGDTTDSLPDEDMPSPPELLLPYGVVAANLEAQNAAFGVTTVDEAALARDLGVPLADARILLERARAEEQQQLLGGVSNLSVTSPETEAMHAMTLGGSASSVIMSAMPALSPSVSIAASSPRVSSVSPVVAHAQPTMGSFMPESTERCAVIDGTGKSTPSPFVRRGGRGRRRPHSSVKKHTIGDASPAGRKQPRSARSSFASIRGSPLRRSGSAFDREDTPPSDIEAPAPPISLEDVLDTSALPHHGLEVADAGSDSSRHLRNLRRWEKVPITTFRQSRRNPESSAGLFGSDVPLQSQGFPHGPASGAVFRPSFSSPSIGTTLAIDYKERQWQKEQNIKKAMLEAEARARRA